MSTSNFTLSGFNPVYFMYLNPELCIASNISTVQQARDFWSLNSESIATPCNLDFVPSALDPAVFIGDNNDRIDISTLNQQIKQTLIDQGYSANDLHQMSTFDVPSIYRSIYFIGSNTFKFNNAGDHDLYTITPSNLQINDKIKITTDYGPPIHTQVESIIDNQTFQVSCNTNVYASANYTLTGIRLYDPLRLARINYLRINNMPQLVNIESDFNYQLYQVLYPDSRALTKEGAYVDYINRFGNNDFRIANVEDLEGTSGNSSNGHSSSSSNFNHIVANYETVNDLKVKNIFTLDFGQETGRFVWNKLCMYYVTDQPKRPLPTVSPYFQGLITEYAIKMYINNIFFPKFTISNLEVKGDALFLGKTTMCNMLALNASISNLTTKQGAFSNLYVDETLSIGGRIGIGANVEQDPNTLYQYNVPNLCNVQVANVHIDNSLFVGGISQMANSIIGTNATFGDVVTGTRFGIGYENTNLNNPTSTTNDYIVSSISITSNAQCAIANIQQANITNLVVKHNLTTFNTQTTNIDTSTCTISSHLTSAGTTLLQDTFISTKLSTFNIDATNANIINNNTSNMSTSNLYVDGDARILGTIQSASSMASTIATNEATISNCIITNTFTAPGYLKCTCGNSGPHPANTSSVYVSFNNTFNEYAIPTATATGTDALIVSIASKDLYGMNVCFNGNTSAPQFSWIAVGL